jgi:hypothetical protein
MKMRPVRADFFRAEGQTKGRKDGRTDKRKEGRKNGRTDGHEAISRFSQL